MLLFFMGGFFLWLSVMGGIFLRRFNLEYFFFFLKFICRLEGLGSCKNIIIIFSFSVGKFFGSIIMLG